MFFQKFGLKMSQFLPQPDFATSIRRFVERHAVLSTPKDRLTFAA